VLELFDVASRKKYVADVYGIVAFAVALVHVMPYAHAAAARRKRRPKTNVSCKNHKFNAKCKNALRFVALLLPDRLPLAPRIWSTLVNSPQHSAFVPPLTEI